MWLLLLGLAQADVPDMLDPVDGQCPRGYYLAGSCSFSWTACAPAMLDGINTTDPLTTTFEQNFSLPWVGPVIHHDIIGDELLPAEADEWLVVAASMDRERPPLVPGPGQAKPTQRRILPPPR